MSDEQPGSEQQAASAQPEPPAGDRWGDPITPKRQAELEETLRQWEEEAGHRDRPGPFAGKELTGAEVFWLAALALANRRGDVTTATNELRRRTGKRFVRHEVSLDKLLLQKANLREAHLEGALLREAHLEGANLTKVHLERAALRGAHLEGAFLTYAQLEGAAPNKAHLEGATLIEAHLEGAFLYGTHLEGANLTKAHLEGADLRRAHLESKTYTPDDADLTRIRQWAHDFPETLLPADLRLAFLDTTTALDGIHLGDAKDGTVQVADVRWGGVNLAVVDWTPFTDKKAVLGDEQAARENGPRAVRANRQLATALRDQGLNEAADHFTYRAQTLQRAVLRGQRQWGGWLFSLLLWALSGYGFRLSRILAAYGGVLAFFTVVYWLMGVHSFPRESGMQALWDSFLVSLSTIHGRAAFEPPERWSLAAWVAAVESVVGIVIEGVFIAMLVQRFFAR